MEKYITVLGVLVAIFITIFLIVGRYVGNGSVDPSFGSCDQISDQNQKNLCLKEIAIKNLDISSCLPIDDSAQRDICLRNIALKTKDRALCDQIVTKNIQRICYSSFT
jgi:hypothetical protein